MKVWQYVVFLKPEQKKDHTPVASEYAIIKDVTTIIAPDEKAVLMAAARGIPDEYANKLDRVEVAVRPF